MLLNVGPFGDFTKYTYEQCVLVPEMDGCRIITNSSSEFLSKVPQYTEDIFRLGSVAESSLLYDACEVFKRYFLGYEKQAFENGDTKVNDHLKTITNLENAVECCVLVHYLI